MSDEGTQLELNLTRGSIVVWTVLCHRGRDQAWQLRILHRHTGEAAMCPSIDVYTGLSLGELRDVIDSTLAPGNGPYELHGAECSPGHPGPTA